MKPITIVLRSSDQIEKVKSILNNLPFDGSMETVIKAHTKKRSTEQNSLYWELLTQISEQAAVFENERPIKYSKQAWHIYFATNFITKDMLKEGEDYRESCPYTGTLVPISTTRLLKDGFSKYIEKITAFAVTELGVQFAAHES